MDNRETVRFFWKTMSSRKWLKLHDYFLEDACIIWHNTKELFTKEEYVKVNKSYPQKWMIELERLEAVDDLVISVVKIHSKENPVSFHGTSFFSFKDGLILRLDEYFGEDEAKPTWRELMKVGKTYE